MMDSKTAQARGYRNNNPGNIKKSADNWAGLAALQSDPVFFQFVSPEYGIRALTKIIQNYVNLYNLRTVEQIIRRYAPSSENQTEKYIEFVSDRIGIAPDTVIDWWELPKLIEAIIRYENGYVLYSQATLTEGMEMAGLLA